MTPTEYLRVFARFWWIVALCVVLGTALSSLVDALITPSYAGTANVYISSVRTRATTSTDAVQGTVLAQQRVGAYADIARGQALAQDVIGELGLSLTPSQLQQMTDIVVPAQTSLLRISVADTDPARARSIAASTASAITTAITDLENSRGTGKPQLRARVVGDAEVAPASLSPLPWRNPLLGGAGGLAVGLGLAVIASRLDRRIRDESTAREMLGVPVLGVLPATGRRSRLRTEPTWDKAVRELRTSIFFLDPVPDRCLTLAITSARPIERLPQIAGDVAAALVDAGARVLLVQADLHQSVQTPLLEADDRPGLGDYLVGDSNEEAVIHHHDASGVDVVPAGSSPANPADLLHSEALATILQKAAQHYDFVLVTTAATSFGTDAAAVAARCDGALVAVARRVTTRRAVRAAVTQLERVDAPLLGGVYLS